MAVCKCGECGLAVKPGQSYVRGHNRRNTASFESILESRTNKADGGCWEAMGSTSKGGYVPIRRSSAVKYAHVLGLEMATGRAVPPGMIVCHTCDNPRCWRNDDHGVYVVDGVEYERCGHLWLGTQAANNRDSVLKGRARKASGAAHPLHGKRLPESSKRFGDQHWTRQHPEKVARGQRAGRNTHPEKYASGEQHWTRRDPERARAVMAKAKEAARGKTHADLL